MLLEKIKKASLVGRSGSRFPVWKKWIRMAENIGRKYLICNIAESEPGVFKDKHILQKEPGKVIGGVMITMKTIGIDEGFLYLKKDYKKLFDKKLKDVIRDKPISLKIKEDLYVAGEETAAINSIEEKRPHPNAKPPYPTESGLWDRPTLVHNLETFYAIAEIADDSYNNEKYYCLSGEIDNEGVFKLGVDLTIEEVLRSTDNYPNFDFLVQVGGGLGGIFLDGDDLKQKCNRLASIKVFKKEKFKPEEKIKSISRLAMYGNCDKCTPCREGIFRVNEMLNSGYYDEDLLEELILALRNSSYCPLGKVLGEVFESLIEINED